jgi:hypothetical protein
MALLDDKMFFAHGLRDAIGVSSVQAVLQLHVHVRPMLCLLEDQAGTGSVIFWELVWLCGIHGHRDHADCI